MAEGQPALTPDLVDFLESGVSILVGTRDAALRPACMRAMGVRIDGAASMLTLHLPEGTAARTLANLRDNKMIAITFSRPTNNRSIQLKGICTDLRPSRDEERTVVECYRAAFLEQLEIIGLPRAVSRRMASWPSVAAVVRVTDIFVQTPGPGAGRRFAGTGGCT
jgi:hypothetical protein